MHAYHMSPALHPVGIILKGNGSPKVEPKIEDALERFRPKAASAVSTAFTAARRATSGC
jgi:hypothetical protein